MYYRYYDKACNEWRGLSPPLSAGQHSSQKRRNGGERWQHCVQFDRPLDLRYLPPRPFAPIAMSLTTELTNQSLLDGYVWQYQQREECEQYHRNEIKNLASE